jgi:hypothetical protein
LTKSFDLTALHEPVDRSINSRTLRNEPRHDCHPHAFSARRDSLCNLLRREVLRLNRMGRILRMNRQCVALDCGPSRMVQWAYQKRRNQPNPDNPNNPQPNLFVVACRHSPAWNIAQSVFLSPNFLFPQPASARPAACIAEHKQRTRRGGSALFRLSPRWRAPAPRMRRHSRRRSGVTPSTTRGAR